MRPSALLVIVAALASGCAGAADPALESGKANPAPAPPAAANLPRVVYYVISEA